ncbi:MAG: acetolactate synthase small subunit [bacterium]|jgi:acetolactate synthase-1/3 small subunit
MTTVTSPKLSSLNKPPTIHTLSVYVANNPGVLARIAQCFSRRGFNIESLVVSPAMDGKFSRMTIGASGNPDGLEQIIKQVSKLIDVLRCVDHTGDNAVIKELAMIKVSITPSERAEVLQIGDHFGGKNLDMSETSMILMFTGKTEKIDNAIRMLTKFKIIEMVRTGKIVMSRGEGES